jgi:hypothetical protein
VPPLRIGMPATSTDAPASFRNAEYLMVSSITLSWTCGSSRSSYCSSALKNPLITEMPDPRRTSAKAGADPYVWTAVSQSPGGNVTSTPVIPADTTDSMILFQKPLGSLAACCSKPLRSVWPQNSGW